MPFDGSQIETPTLRRAMLIDALRHPMPDGWIWNFEFQQRAHICGSAGCALGLARKLGLWNGREPVETAFDLTTRDAAIFHSFGDCNTPIAPWYGVHNSQVTPSMVADALEAVGG
jgi:hypothetical protein